ncbi:Ribosome biogenesis protein [Cerrena zonata]|uniref:Ribosome biogenesis protein n=1 Tax=Cerrena zonata TaxID=2478898 RepID=A0AAW0G1V5_9APHY
MSSFFKSFGWKEGDALQKGGLKKPILVKHKKDTKGLGHDSNDADVWWERLFDGQLKNLDVSNGTSGTVQFSKNEKAVEESIRKANSPLYRMFVKGQGLAGTVGDTESVKVKSMELDAKHAFDVLLGQMTEPLKKKSSKEKKDKSKSKDKSSKSKDKTNKRQNEER